MPRKRTANDDPPPTEREPDHTGQLVVLYGFPTYELATVAGSNDSNSEESDVIPAPPVAWYELGRFPSSGGHAGAKRKAVAALRGLADNIDSPVELSGVTPGSAEKILDAIDRGDGVLLRAVPLKSWQPVKPTKVKHRDPVLEVG